MRSDSSGNCEPFAERSGAHERRGHGGVPGASEVARQKAVERGDGVKEEAQAPDQLQ
jgi:hypothetical protein